MASKPALPPLAERADIHKSCKSLETLLSVLNDYCEAAGATVILQKKLVKALRETAGMKTTGEIAANALNASAIVFEVSSDIDSKFAKIADKEYDALSAEVKKWFKKLAKEEKTHDERMASTNARIKQAGQVYEKKSKRNPRDATEEHARYINLISSLGPEISQERYNHSLNVTQRHTATTYSAAVCLSRIADAEWLKTCEGVRRHSSTIGQLGEWRALCEGGWQGPVPPDLVDPDENQPPLRYGTVEKPEAEESQNTNGVGKFEVKEPQESTEHINLPNTRVDSEPLRAQLTTKLSPTMNTNDLQSSPIILDHAFSATLEQTSPQRTDFAPSAYDAPRAKDTNMDSVRSLSAFPMPPTHFPIPPRREQASQSRSSQSSTSYITIPRISESPGYVEGNEKQSVGPPGAGNLPAQVKSASLSQKPEAKSSLLEIDAPSRVTENKDSEDPMQPISAKTQVPIPSVVKPERHYDELLHVNDENTQQGAEDTFDREFGMNVGYARSRAANAVYSPTLRRTDSGASSGSIVAAMRNRYQDHAASSGVVSPAPKAVHHLSANISDLASRYQPSETPSSPGPSTPASRQLPLPPSDSSRTRGADSRNNPASGSKSPTAPTSPRHEEAARRRQQRLNDITQLELHEKELALRERERELQQKTRELERERVRLDNVHEVEENGPTHDVTRGSSAPAYVPLRPRERKPSFRTQRPQSQLDPGNSGYSQNLPRPQPQYNLNPPSPSSNSVQHSHEGQSRAHSPYTNQYPHSPSSSTQFPSSTTDHAPYCGCGSCSAAKYRVPPESPPDPASLRPLAEPIVLRPQEKKSSWMRRLSMPVGNAFSLDSKKNASTQNLAGISSAQVREVQGRSRIFSLDGKKNASSTQLNTYEDGRRNYDANGIFNRSMSNLGLGGRR